MIKGLKGLEDYDWSEMPKTRTYTEMLKDRFHPFRVECEFQHQ